MIQRLLRHMLTQLDFRIFFSPSGLKKIQSLIQQGESKHAGQLRFVAEYAFNVAEIFQKKSSKDKAAEIFSDLRIWDTEQNCGVLLYLLIAERRIEILVDRGISKKVSDDFWQKICEEMRSRFRKKKFETGVLEAIRKINEVLIEHFPSDPSDPKTNELSDAPVVIR